MPCAKKYTPVEVKNILNYSEGTSPSTVKVGTKTVPTLFGDVTIALNSDEKTGHAQQRHLIITETGLRDRTLGAGADTGLEQASAFVADRLKDLIFVVTNMLNCAKGQEGLAVLDAYAEQGKTRVVIVEDARVLNCTHIGTRVFYQGDSKSKSEKLARAAMVLDSNIGGKQPFKIVTAFPCQEDPRLEVGLSNVMIQARDASKDGNNPFLLPVKDLMKKIEAWTRKSYKKIPRDLLHGNTFLVGEIFSSSWFTPNPAIYKYKYPINEDKDSDKRLDGKPSYDMGPAGKPPESRMSTPVLREQLEAAGLRLLEVDARTKLGIFLVN
jgi:hypothetical protein